MSVTKEQHSQIVCMVDDMINGIYEDFMYQNQKHAREVLTTVKKEFNLQLAKVDVKQLVEMSEG